MPLILKPDWQLPPNIGAAYTYGYKPGQGEGYGEFNLALHVGDDDLPVTTNRHKLSGDLGLVQEPLWLNQVHGSQVAQAGVDVSGVTADAAVAREPGQAVAVMTADCLPVLFAAVGERTVVAAAHAGWRGLCAGVLENTVKQMGVPASSIQCWLGPAIGPKHFEVGPEVKAAFEEMAPEAAAAFVPQGDKYLADIYALARQRLNAMDVTQIAGGGMCTVSDGRFYSYRRSGQGPNARPAPCGRMASLIWLK